MTQIGRSWSFDRVLAGDWQLMRSAQEGMQSRLLSLVATNQSSRVFPVAEICLCMGPNLSVRLCLVGIERQSALLAHCVGSVQLQSHSKVRYQYRYQSDWVHVEPSNLGDASRPLPRCLAPTVGVALGRTGDSEAGELPARWLDVHDLPMPAWCCSAQGFVESVERPIPDLRVRRAGTGLK